jgi:hypothetical protein
MVTTRRSVKVESSTTVTTSTTSTNNNLTSSTKTMGSKTTTNNNNNDNEKSHPMMSIIFISLLLDLLAFTMILPLLPSLMDLYQQNDDSGLFQWLLKQVQFCQNLLGVPDRYNSVLFGGNYYEFYIYTLLTVVILST